MDAASYINSTDILDFAREFGYEDDDQARVVWKACGEVCSQLLDMLGESGLDDLFAVDPFSVWKFDRFLLA